MSKNKKFLTIIAAAMLFVLVFAPKTIKMEQPQPKDWSFGLEGTLQTETPGEQSFACSLEQQLQNMNEEFTIASDLSKEKIVKIIRAESFNPEIFWVEDIKTFHSKSKGQYRFVVEYKMGEEKRDSIAWSLTEKCNEISNTTPEGINKFLLKNIRYNKEAAKAGAESIMTGNAACCGISKAAALLSLHAGKKAGVIIGYTPDNEYHAWNGIESEEFDFTYGVCNPRKGFSTPQGYSVSESFWFVPRSQN